jgi:hypothetical protein
LAEKAVLVNYILRIYRFQAEEPVKLIGVVEEVGAKKKKKAFTNLKELWEILSSSEELKDKEGVGTIQNP